MGLYVHNAVGPMEVHYEDMGRSNGGLHNADMGRSTGVVHNADMGRWVVCTRLGNMTPVWCLAERMPA